jgi:hypothetical protein
MPSGRRAVRVLAVAMVLSLLGAGDAVACPNCKEAVSATSSEASGMSDGFNWSVMFMLCVPFSLLGTGAFMVRRAVKNGTFPEL